MPEQPYSGQVAIITGAGSGIGRATARRLADGGATVAIVDQDLTGAEETLAQVKASGGRGSALLADVSRGSDVEATVQHVRDELGVPSILVNNAGISRGGRVSDISEEDWDLVLAVNLRGTFLFLKHVVPLMVDQRYGRIINISSGTAIRTGPGSGPYGASKAGIIALTKSVAGEVATRNITANVVAPGITDTAMTRAQFGDADRLQQEATAGRIANPMKIVIQPEDIAHTVAFLAHPDTRYITGQTLHVNAGSFMP